PSRPRPAPARARPHRLNEDHKTSRGVTEKSSLRGILKDEIWHVSYINEELQRRALHDPGIQDIIDRALAADERTMAELADIAAVAQGTGTGAQA
ncbi:hypothetical protein ABZ772_36115, partial [Streptomyces griseoincarnatus]